MEVKQIEKIKIYVTNVSSGTLGGGHTFLRNFKKTLESKVQFVNTWQECDIIFVFGITAMDKGLVHEAVKQGKKLVLRIDNIPRKSRNKRMQPAERLTEFGNIASAVVYQSKWAKEFAGYFIKNDNEVTINNGVDSDFFNNKDRFSDGNTYLYIDYNPNPNKRFEEALYWFEMEWRKNNKAKLIIAGNSPKVYKENPQFNWDLNVNAQVDYIGVLERPESIALLMKKCDYLLYPSFCEAYPNTLLEAMACDVRPLYLNRVGGSMEVYHNSRILKIDNSKKFATAYKVKTIDEMGEEYLELFKKLC